jgi:hypothetical protein
MESPVSATSMCAGDSPRAGNAMVWRGPREVMGDRPPGGHGCGTGHDLAAAPAMVRFPRGSDREGAAQSMDSGCWRGGAQPVAQRDHAIPIRSLDLDTCNELTFGLPCLAFTGK